MIDYACHDAVTAGLNADYARHDAVTARLHAMTLLITIVWLPVSMLQALKQM